MFLFLSYLKAQGEPLEKALEAALEAGYRHIDTAHAYDNEAVIGRILHRWLVLGKLKSTFAGLLS